MSQREVVSIGGVDYDKQTGHPIIRQVDSITKPVKNRQPAVPAHGIHASNQRSAALNRRFVKKAPAATSPAKNRATRSMDVRPRTNRSPQITKFAPAAQPQQVHQPITHDIAPVQHPVVAKVEARRSAVVSQPQERSAQDIKHAELGKALLNASPSTKQVQPKKHRGRTFGVAAASLGLLIVGGYFTYVNLPSLSVRVAAAQAGIEASFPEYRPVGYHLNGPVAYQNGEVNMSFASNSGPLGFSLTQSRSSWDSSALLEKYVDPNSSGKYATYNDAGLTIYTYGTSAAWVNGGILYTLEGTATLSNEQIRRIATSM